MAVHFKIAQILKFLSESFLRIFCIPARILKHLGIIHRIIAYRRPMSGNGYAAQSELFTLKIHHAVLTVFQGQIRLFFKAQPGKHRNAVMIARPHLLIIAIGPLAPCAESVIPPARSHIAALMHLAVLLDFMIYFHHVFKENPGRYIRKGSARKTHFRPGVILGKFKFGRQQIILRFKSKQRMHNFAKRVRYIWGQRIVRVYCVPGKKFVLVYF